MKNRCLIYVLILSTATAEAVFADAFAREEGRSMVASQLRQSSDETADDLRMNVDFEYGMTSQWAVGGGLEYSPESEEFNSLNLFARWHFPSAARDVQKAVGLEIRKDNGDTFLTPSIHLGRGLDTYLGRMVLDLELKAKTDSEVQEVDYQAYAFASAKPVEQIQTRLAVDVKSIGESPQVEVIPSVSWEFSQDKFVNVELTHAIQGEALNELAMGLWLEF